MDKYYFLYKDSTGRWNPAINPSFIASHQHCRAIPKEVVHDRLHYELVSDLVYDLNENKISEQSTNILIGFDIYW